MMHRRRALTLLELVAVLAIVGLLAAVSIRFAVSLGNVEGQVDARRLALDLAQARRRAISTGDNHLVRFQLDGSTVTGYEVCRNSGGTVTAVDELQQFGGDVAIKHSANEMEFNFEGEALAAYTVIIVGDGRYWYVTVAQATGAVRVVEKSLVKVTPTPIEPISPIKSVPVASPSL